MTFAERKRWQRHFVYRRESWRTTWKLRLGVVVLLLAIVLLTRGLWTARIGQSLVCPEQSPRSDALLLENFDPDYLVFERAATLQRAGVAGRVVVPVTADDFGGPNIIKKGVAELMARVARLENIEVIPIPEIEPISLHAAQAIRDYLTAQHVGSVIVVSPGFRSRRSALVYNAAFTPAGIRLSCVPVFGTKTPEDWTDTWHGIQDVFLQYFKLEYYRFYVLR